MAESRRGRGRGRGGAPAFKWGKEGPKRWPSTRFEISEDGIQFTFPAWQSIPKDPSILNRFNASFKLLGGYSEDEEKNFCNEKSYMNFMNMKYYPSQSSRELKVNLHLNARDNVEPYTGSPKQSFDNFLMWILSNQEVFTQALGLDKEIDGKCSKFVTVRNVLSEISMDYNCKGANSFFATYYDGAVYLLRDQPKQPTENVTLHNWGHTFEELVTHTQRKNEKVITNNDYRIVTSFFLGEHQMILSSATDCFNPDKYSEGIDDTSALIALKCCYDNPNNQKTKTLERYKMFNWCLGLYLNGTPELVVGYRDNCGNVDLLKLYDKRDLIEKGKGYWDIESVFIFLRHLLSFVKDRTRSKPGAIFHFVKKDHSNIYTCSEAQKELVPEWFRNEYKKQLETSDKVPRG